MKLSFGGKPGWKGLLFGVVIFLVGLCLIVLDPVGLMVKKMMKMENGTLAHEMFKKIPTDIILKIYILNITNSADFLSGKDKNITFNEIGPYVFREIRGNTNITYYENGTASYVPNITVEYIPELSVGNMYEDRLFTVNIPLLGILSTNSNATFVKRMAINALISTLKSQTILNLTVNEFMWGYEDKLIRMASGYMPNWISFSKFGIVDRMYANSNDVITMDVNETSPEAYSIQTWNQSPGLKFWGFEDLNTSLPCNTLKGSYEGILYPSTLEVGAPLRLYKKMFCRVLTLQYTKEVLLESGLRGYYYELPNTELSCKNPDNICFCPKNGPCLPEGLTDVTPCYYGLPIAISLPHFYGGDSSLLDRYRGLNPDKEKHSTFVIVQPDMGKTIKFSTKTQINLVLDNLKYYSKAKVFSNMVIPILWIDAGVSELPSDLLIKIQLAFLYMPIAEIYLGWILIVIGLALMLYKILPSFKAPQKTKEIDQHLAQYSPVSLTEKPDFLPQVKRNSIVT